MKTGWVKYEITTKGSRSTEYAYIPYVCVLPVEDQKGEMMDWIDTYEGWTRGCEYFSVSWEVNVTPPMRVLTKEIAGDIYRIASAKKRVEEHLKLLEILTDAP